MENLAKVLDAGKYWQKRWQDVKDDFWGDLKQHTLRALKKFLETSMEVQIQDLVGADHWEHNDYRRGYRNGYYYRHLDTSMGEARKIYLAKNQKEALSVFKTWSRKWRKLVPKAVKYIEEDYEYLVPFLNEPVEYRIKIRTTNAIERMFREVRRRIRPMNCFENCSSVERIIFSVFNRFNGVWENDAHLEARHFYQEK